MFAGGEADYSQWELTALGWTESFVAQDPNDRIYKHRPQGVGNLDRQLLLLLGRSCNPAKDKSSAKTSRGGSPSRKRQPLRADLRLRHAEIYFGSDWTEP